MAAKGDGSDADAEVISADVRPIRDLGGCIGQSVDLDALRELGLVDDDGEIVETVHARQRVYSDGRIVIEPVGDSIAAATGPTSSD